MGNVCWVSDQIYLCFIVHKLLDRETLIDLLKCLEVFIFKHNISQNCAFNSEWKKIGRRFLQESHKNICSNQKTITWKQKQPTTQNTKCRYIWAPIKGKFRGNRWINNTVITKEMNHSKFIISLHTSKTKISAGYLDKYVKGNNMIKWIKFYNITKNILYDYLFRIDAYIMFRSREMYKLDIKPKSSQTIHPCKRRYVTLEGSSTTITSTSVSETKFVTHSNSEYEESTRKRKKYRKTQNVTKLIIY